MFLIPLHGKGVDSFSVKTCALFMDTFFCGILYFLVTGHCNRWTVGFLFINFLWSIQRNWNNTGRYQGCEKDVVGLIKMFLAVWVFWGHVACIFMEWHCSFCELPSSLMFLMVFKPQQHIAVLFSINCINIISAKWWIEVLHYNRSWLLLFWPSWESELFLDMEMLGCCYSMLICLVVGLEWLDSVSSHVIIYAMKFIFCSMYDNRWVKKTPILFNVYSMTDAYAFLHRSGGICNALECAKQLIPNLNKKVKLFAMISTGEIIAPSAHKNIYPFQLDIIALHRGVEVVLYSHTLFYIYFKK